MKRKFLFSFYETPHGKLLQKLECDYLRRSITVSCKQTIMQLGYLGWEYDFIDCSFFQKYSILDIESKGCANAVKIRAKSCRLPIQSETVDLVIVPHLLEFDANRFQTMREIERVLKAEGEVIFLNFNPLSFWIRLQFLWDIKMSDSWLGHFIMRRRISDWLKLLNFEITTTSEINLDSIKTTSGQFKLSKRTFFSMTYAVRATKRQYQLIPLTPIKFKTVSFATASNGLKSNTHKKNRHD
ncbi:MAG: class I SAM-dependent methyltransferase [Methylococcales symbiont of Hymedesmia sp. n. MRB-2018]|nr:MAG: class I SAM-dependent methyltransferase [Methylococcales symbiont of Hymedesmia sp. n. MRB-2018]KAF3983737.1 MAG: class I SAM-dependent methyltransferase [Methylococcales symbiont of Hymedesmia sp. n. MRB-2018]